MRPEEVFKRYDAKKLSEKDYKVFYKYYMKECVAFYLKQDNHNSYIIIKTDDDIFYGFRKEYTNNDNTSILHRITRLSLKDIKKIYYSKYYYTIRTYRNNHLIKKFKEWLVLEGI